MMVIKGDNPAHLRRSQVYLYLMNGEMIYNVRFGKEVAVKDGRYNGSYENPVTFFFII